jgi:RNA 2',3'-cyclic 3'-phosphodiesterase
MPDAPTPEPFRLFIAVTIPEEIKAEIEQAQLGLRRALPKECVRWTKREQFHLTLKFLGNVGADRVAALIEALRGICQDFMPLDLRAEGMGFFPDARRPRVVWVGVNDRREQLARVQRAVETATRDYTEEESTERYAGHVTLGRIKGLRRSEADALARCAADRKTHFFGAWTADHVDLFRSQLSPNGAQHTVLAAIPMTAASVR